MGNADYFARGQWNFECDRCDHKMKSEDMRFEWNGLIVCPKCYDPRQPQDFTRGRKDQQSVRDPRADPEP